jgi:beclin 1
MNTSTTRNNLSQPDNLSCQRCHQPLILDPSIADLTPSSQNLITSTLPGPSRLSTLSQDAKLAALPPSSRESAKIWHDNTAHRNVAESFILLNESSILPVQNQSLAALGGPALASNLHTLLSSKTPISHPLCTECTALLQSELQKEVEELSRERDAYINFERGILRNREGHGRRKSLDEGLWETDLEGTGEEWEALMKRKEELEREEERLKLVLEQKEKELDQVKIEEERSKREEEQLEREEEE